MPGPDTTEIDTREKALRLAGYLRDLLDPKNLPILLTIPPDGLSGPQRVVFKQLYEHFNTEGSAPPEGDPEGIIVARPRGRPSKRPRITLTEIAPGSSWGAVRSLKELNLDQLLATQLNQFQKTRSCVFLGRATPSANLVPDLAGKTSIDILVLGCISLKSLESEMTIVRVRWLFMTLLIGDLAQEMFGSTTPLNPRRRQELRKSITENTANLSDAERARIGVNEAEDSTPELIERAIKCGERLRVLCDEFTTGCLFWLQDVLTSGFINSRMTTKGQAYRDAVKVLRELELPEKIRTSGAPALGDAVRAELREIYRVDQIVQLSF